jgi:hypothetical protein
MGADQIVLFNHPSFERQVLSAANGGEVLNSNVDVYELIGWGLDDYAYRNCATSVRQRELENRIERARKILEERERYADGPALLREKTESVRPLLTGVCQRKDLREEYEAFSWELGVVDLRHLLAFQRRLVFSAALPGMCIPAKDSWPQLVSLALGSQRTTRHHLVCNKSTIDGMDIRLHSSNPDLRVRLSRNADHGDYSPISLYGGSPFFEVAEFRGRWFLRDGYHRAYRLLQAGVHQIPSVIIHARTIGELGATDLWFFGEEQLFSDHPPRVTDFLDENLILRYERTALRKVIRIRIEESLEPFDETEELQGEEI